MGGPGSGGHNKKTRELKILSGSLRRDRDREQPPLWQEQGESQAQPPKRPPALSREAKRLWEAVTTSFELDGPGLMLLRLALEALDRLRQAQAMVRREGLTVVNPKSGALQCHPALRCEVEARQAILRCWAALGLDFVPVPGGEDET